MCGIFGSVRLDGGENGDEALVTEGVRLLRHRGPDAWGVRRDGPVCFGHARLSIIDLSGGGQPMEDPAREGLVTYNGEVYNFRDVRSDLEREGRSFETSSDTEVVLNAFLQWGGDCLSRFRGMFALAALDRRSGRVFVARDRVGKKPLFYTQRDGTLFFSSELEPLYRTLGPFRMDPEALDDCLAWQYIPAPKTIYEEVRCLEPAHCLLVDTKTGRIEDRRYWDLVFREDASLTFEEWVERLDREIRQAVELRLVSDVPFGAFLSGGIDSSLVVGYMSEILEQPVRTFSIGFENADYSELEYAGKVAEICRTDHRVEIVRAESLEILPLLVQHYGQPFADSSAIPTYYVSRMAAGHVKMVLSGDGGDENFAGYNTYEQILARCDGGPRPADRLRRLAARWLGARMRWRERSALPGEAFGIHSALYCHFTPEQRRMLFRDRWKGVVREPDPRRGALLESGDVPLVSRLQHLDIMTYLPFDILTKVDIASMANALEVRCPLLDHRLMEEAATIPARFKIGKGPSNGGPRYDKKRILKALALKRFPREIMERPKWGFGIPLGEWFAGELRAPVRERLLSSPYLPAFFDRMVIEDLLERHSPRQDMSARLWNLLFLEEWMAQHADSLPGS